MSFFSTVFCLPLFLQAILKFSEFIVSKVLMVGYSCGCLVVHCKTLLYEIFIQKTKILRKSFIIYHLYFLTNQL